MVSPMRVKATSKTLWSRRGGSGLISNRKGGVIRVNNMLLVNGLRMKLLSISALYSRGSIIVTNSDTMTLYERSHLILSGSARGRVYIFDRVYNPKTAALVVIAKANNVSSASSSRPAILYYNRFSYLNPRSLRGINACTDSKIPRTIINTDYDTCVLTKLTNRHQKTEARALSPLEKISADFISPFHTSLNGKTILLTITNSYSRKV